MAEDTKIVATRAMFLLKLIELCLAILCVGLIVDPIGNKLQKNTNHISLVSVTYAGFIIINSIAIVGQMKSERMPKLMWVLFTLTGGALFIAAGSVIIHDWRLLWDRSKHMGYSKHYMDMMIASGIIGLFNGAIYFFDFILSVVYG